MTTKFRRRVLTRADWQAPPASPTLIAEPTPGVVRSDSGYERPDRRRPEHAKLRDLRAALNYALLVHQTEYHPAVQVCRNALYAERLRLGL